MNAAPSKHCCAREKLHGRAHNIIAEAFNKQEILMKQEHNESRRQFIQKSAVLGTGVLLAGPGGHRLFAQGNQAPDPAKGVASKGYAEKSSPTGITQGGYANNIVVKERFAIQLPKIIRLQDAAPLLCAGITTYSPLVKASIKKGDKVGVAGVGGLGHLAIKLAVAKGAEVYAFTT